MLGLKVYLAHYLSHFFKINMNNRPDKPAGLSLYRSQFSNDGCFFRLLTLLAKGANLVAMLRIRLLSSQFLSPVNRAK